MYASPGAYLYQGCTAWSGLAVFKRIVKHTTRKGGDADDLDHHRGTAQPTASKQNEQIERLKDEKAVLVDKISKNYLGRTAPRRSTSCNRDCKRKSTRFRR